MEGDCVQCRNDEQRFSQKDSMPSMTFKLVPLEHAEPGLIRRLAEIDATLPSEYAVGYEASADSIAERIVRLTESIGNDNAFVMTARNGRNEVVGLHWVCLVEGNEACAYVNTTWVDPSCRKQGIGSALKDAGENWARQRGATQMATSVALTNDAMVEFNRRRGFTPTSIDMLKKL